MRRIVIDVPDEDYFAILRRKLEIEKTYKEILMEALDLQPQKTKMGRPTLEDQKHALDGIYEEAQRKRQANLDGISPEEVEDTESQGLDGIHEREKKKWQKHM